MQPDPNQVKKESGNRIGVGHSGDYVVHKLKANGPNELRFPNRYMVDDWAEGDQSRVQVNPAKLEALGIFQEDPVLIKGRFKKQTHAIVIASEDCDPTKIKMCKQIRKNCNVNVGDIISLHAAADSLQYSKKIKILPFSDDIKGVTGDIFDLYIRPFFKDKFRPVTQGDCFVLPGGTKPIEFKIVLTEPLPACIVADGGEIFFEGDPVDREEDEKARKDLIGYSDLGGIEKELQMIREMVELPLKHPILFENLGIKPPRGILLHGPPGCGKSTIGRAIANETGAFFLLINGPEIMSAMAGESEKNLRMAFEKADEEARTSGCAIIFIDEIDVIGGSREQSRGEVEKRIVSQLLTLMDGIKPRSNVLVMAATNRPNSLDASLRRFGRFDREIALGVPDGSGRLHILQLKTRKMKLAEDVDLEWIAENANGYVGADIAQLCTEAAMLCIREKAELIDYQSSDLPEGMLEAMKVEMKHFKTALGVCNPSTLRDTFVEIPKTSWADIGGLHDVKKTLKELIQFPIQYAEQYERLGVEPSRGCLFFGPPGNGKTLLAKAIANECQTNFISVKGPELMSMWVGESERGVRQVFDKARQAQPCVLFMDELDSVAKHRGGGGGGGEGVNDRMLNQLLTEIDGVGSKKNVFVIGATNRPDTIDPALIRGGRLDQLIYIGMPDYEGRISVLKAALRKSKVAPDVDLAQIAAVTEGYSGADLAEVTQKTVQMAIRDSVGEFNKQMTKLNMERQIKEQKKEKIDETYFEKRQQEIESQFGSGILTKRHFELAVRQSRQSVSDTDVKRYEAFKQQFCDASQGGYASNPKVADFKFVDGGFVPPAPVVEKIEPIAQQKPAESKRGLPKNAGEDEFF
ncbi:Cell_division protein 48 [Hexamita inflata]|uniref:Cell division protein 48 n=1 Tax=Hexamita inflata TaxID=28002 RepID=A0AA86TSJ8_9EUKA|nr:Cell division protein 48 [Hexamita inflata]